MERKQTRQLIALHRLLQELDQTREQLENVPRQIAAAQRSIDRKTSELEALSEKLKAQKKRADEKNLQLRTSEAKIKDLQIKLNAATSNREFDVIRKQIEADRMAASVLEDEILEILGQIDELTAEIKQAEAELEKLKQHKEKVAREAAATEPQLKQQIADLEKRIAAAEQMFEGDTLMQFRRLVAAHGASALAAAEGGVCSACYIELSPQMRVELNSDKLVFCRSCGRLLYLPET